MEIIDFQDVFKSKYARQQEIEELEIDANGYCIHLEKISYGYVYYFLPRKQFEQEFIEKCMFLQPNEYFIQTDLKNKIIAKNLFLLKNYPLRVLSFNSIEDEHFNVEDYLIIKNNIIFQPYTYLYLNAENSDKNILEEIKDKIKPNELRFSLTLSNFSDKAFRNIQEAKNLGFIINIEEPSVPANKINILKALPILNEIDIHHLVIREVKITKKNDQNLHNYYSKGKAYKDTHYYLYDEGLVYDVIEKTLSNNYRFSILDHSAAVDRLINPFYDGGPLFNFFNDNEYFFLKG